VAVVGIGNMGLAMALRLRDAGQAVRVHDIDTGRHALAEHLMAPGHDGSCKVGETQCGCEQSVHERGLEHEEVRI
jgi:3-hydroxyisobutyrate dehydrogenase-like beta-hydroxyacid dehydrogenase